MQRRAICGQLVRKRSDAAKGGLTDFSIDELSVVFPWRETVVCTKHIATVLPSIGRWIDFLTMDVHSRHVSLPICEPSLGDPACTSLSTGSSLEVSQVLHVLRSVSFVYPWRQSTHEVLVSWAAVCLTHPMSVDAYLRTPSRHSPCTKSPL